MKSNLSDEEPDEADVKIFTPFLKNDLFDINEEIEVYIFGNVIFVENIYFILWF